MGWLSIGFIIPLFGGFLIMIMIDGFTTTTTFTDAHWFNLIEHMRKIDCVCG